MDLVDKSSLISLLSSRNIPNPTTRTIELAIGAIAAGVKIFFALNAATETAPIP